MTEPARKKWYGYALSDSLHGTALGTMWHGDKRAHHGNQAIWAERRRPKPVIWDYCKYCHTTKVPTWLLVEGRTGNPEPTSIIRYCLLCGHGLTQEVDR